MSLKSRHQKRWIQVRLESDPDTVIEGALLYRAIFGLILGSKEPCFCKLHGDDYTLYAEGGLPVGIALRRKEDTPLYILVAELPYPLLPKKENANATETENAAIHSAASDRE